MKSIGHFLYEGIEFQMSRFICINIPYPSNIIPVIEAQFWNNKEPQDPRNELIRHYEN